MSKTKNKIGENLGFKRPLGHKEKSVKHILHLIDKEKPRATIKPKIVWGILSGIAATLFLVFSLNQSAILSTQPSTVVIEEDVFVTSLLMDTLLLEEAELDQAIQEALLDDFENDLVLN